MLFLVPSCRSSFDSSFEFNRTFSRITGRSSGTSRIKVFCSRTDHRHTTGSAGSIKELDPRHAAAQERSAQERSSVRHIVLLPHVVPFFVRFMDVQPIHSGTSSCSSSCSLESQRNIVLSIEFTGRSTRSIMTFSPIDRVNGRTSTLKHFVSCRHCSATCR
jgi:hypothetical protein